VPQKTLQVWQAVVSTGTEFVGKQHQNTLKNGVHIHYSTFLIPLSLLIVFAIK